MSLERQLLHLQNDAVAEATRAIERVSAVERRYLSFDTEVAVASLRLQLCVVMADMLDRQAVAERLDPFERTVPAPDGGDAP